MRLKTTESDASVETGYRALSSPARLTDVAAATPVLGNTVEAEVIAATERPLRTAVRGACIGGLTLLLSLLGMFWAAAALDSAGIDESAPRQMWLLIAAAAILPSAAASAVALTRFGFRLAGRRKTAVPDGEKTAAEAETVLSGIALLLGAGVLYSAVGVFQFIVVRPWKNMVAEFVILLLVGAALLFFALRGFARLALRSRNRAGR